MLRTQLPDVLNLMKALADTSRLHMLSWMSAEECTVSGLAERLSLSEPTVSHHVARLHAAGLLSLRMAGTQRFYRVNPERMARLRAYVADLDKPLEEPADTVNDTSWIAALPFSPEDRKVLGEYTFNGRLVRFPNKEKRWLVILRWLVTLFEPGRRYREREVNAILAVVNPDVASLRRDLVEFGFMRRERGGGDYWRTPDDEADGRTSSQTEAAP